MAKLASCCLAAVLLVSCGSEEARSRAEAVRLCRLATQARPVYFAAVTMANTVVGRTSDWLPTADADPGAAVARRCLRLTRSLAEPEFAIKDLRKHFERIDLRTSKNRAARAELVSRLAAIENELYGIHSAIHKVETAAMANPQQTFGANPAIPDLQKRITAFKPAGDAVSPVIQRLRKEHGISDSELEMIRRPPRTSYALA